MGGLHQRGVQVLAEIALILEFWPVEVASAPAYWSKEFRLLGRSGTIEDSSRLIVLVLLAGGVGGILHCLRSYRAFVGNSLLGTTWIWWYILRPFEGAIVALAFYFVLAGGLTSSNELDLSIAYL